MPCTADTKNWNQLSFTEHEGLIALIYNCFECSDDTRKLEAQPLLSKEYCWLHCLPSSIKLWRRIYSELQPFTFESQHFGTQEDKSYYQSSREKETSALGKKMDIMLSKHMKCVSEDHAIKRNRRISWLHIFSISPDAGLCPGIKLLLIIFGGRRCFVDLGW